LTMLRWIHISYTVRAQPIISTGSLYWFRNYMHLGADGAILVVVSQTALNQEAVVVAHNVRPSQEEVANLVRIYLFTPFRLWRLTRDWLRCWSSRRILKRSRDGRAMGSKPNLGTRQSGSYNMLLKIDGNSRSNFFLLTSPF